MSETPNHTRPMLNRVIFALLTLVLGGLAGGLLSGKLFDKVPVTLLRRVLGVLILYGGVRAVLLL